MTCGVFVFYDHCKADARRFGPGAVDGAGGDAGGGGVVGDPEGE